MGHDATESTAIRLLTRSKKVGTEILHSCSVADERRIPGFLAIRRPHFTETTEQVSLSSITAQRQDQQGCSSREPAATTARTKASQQLLTTCQSAQCQCRCSLHRCRWWVEHAIDQCQSFHKSDTLDNHLDATRTILIQIDAGFPLH